MLKTEFIAHYADELRAAMAKPSNGYAANLDAGEVAAKMVAAIEAGTYSHTSAPALKSLTARFNIPHTRKGIMEWYAANVTAEPVGVDDVTPPVKPTIAVGDDLDLEMYLGKTGYVRTESNAYFGTIGELKDGYVHITNASDLTGDHGLELRVPRAKLWAIVDAPVRQPTNDDIIALAEYIP